MVVGVVPCPPGDDFYSDDRLSHVPYPMSHAPCQRTFTSTKKLIFLLFFTHSTIAVLGVVQLLDPTTGRFHY